MLTPAEATRTILDHVQPLEGVRVSLPDALGLVLAETIRSPIDLPPWDNASMDGYAVRADDVAHARPDRPVALTVVEAVPAGRFPTRSLRSGEAVRVFTGSPIPDGTEGVVRQEDTVAPVAGQVVVTNARDARRNIRRRGEDLRQGATVLSAGQPLGPAQLGLLAAIAHGEPLIHRRPRIAFLASGDELAGLGARDDILAGRKVASSNSFTLRALVQQTGGEPLDLGIAPDSRDALRAHLARADRPDLLVTTGGVSVGEHDLLRRVMAELGAELKFWRIRMRPGAPVAFGVLHGTPWIGLPGNPVSTMVTFELFVRPAIRRLLGHACPYRRTVRVRVEESIALGPPLRHYLRAIVKPGLPGTVPTARLTGPQGSGILSSMALANGLVIVPEDRSTVPAGTELDALLLDDPTHTSTPDF